MDGEHLLFVLAPSFGEAAKVLKNEEWEDLSDERAVEKCLRECERLSPTEGVQQPLQAAEDAVRALCYSHRIGGPLMTGSTFASP